MNKTVKLGIFAGSILAGIASLTPLTTYATNTNVSVKVNSAITLDSVGTPAQIVADPNSIQTSDFSVKVTTNAGYKIQMNASSATDTALHVTGVTDTIPAGTPSAGSNKWAIKVKNAADTTYKAITTTAADFYSAQSGTGASGATTTFTVGVSIASTLTAANYATTIVVTALNG